MKQYIFLLFYINSLKLNYQCEAEESIKQVNLNFEILREAAFATIKDHDSLVLCKIILSDARSETEEKFDATDVNYDFNGNLCTHLILEYLEISDSFEIVKDEDVDEIKKLRSVKRKFPHLKLLLLIDRGADEKERDFMSNLVNSAENRQKFITNMKKTVQSLHLSGIVLDSNLYYYAPENITVMAREIKDEFQNENFITAVEISLMNPMGSYENIAGISRSFDLVIIVFGLMNAVEGAVTHAGYDAPLYSEKKNTENVYDDIKILFSKWQVNPRNLIAGYILRTPVHILQDKSTANKFPFGYGSTITSNTTISPWRKVYNWGYDEICATVISDVRGWKMYWDDTANVPFLVNGKQWVNFENPRSMVAKAELHNYLGFKGVAISSINYDDTLKRCSNISYPLLKSVNWGLSKSKSLRGSQQCSLFILDGDSSTVEYDPVLTLSSKLLKVNYGDSVEVNCTVEGSPPFKSEWKQMVRKDKFVPIKGSNNEILTSKIERFCTIEILTSTLKIKHVHKNGNYICHLSYANGTITDEIDFRIQVIEAEYNSSKVEKGDIAESASSYWATVIVLNLFIISGVVIGICIFVRSQLKKYREMKKIIDLLIGNKTSKIEANSNADQSTIDPLQLPFEEKYEIKENTFVIDRSKSLGKGECGEVYKGLLVGTDKTVAFKTVGTNGGISSLKALISELKIMMYVGSHENIVAILGVYKAEIRSGILHIAMEFCELGSLESFLRKNKSLFLECPILNPNHEKLNSLSDVQPQPLYSIQSLLKWSLQISTALEYLGTKKVLHMDLATRNVLLTAEGDAKVTDFGLSRRTYSYTEYKKNSKDSLPWRLLALECLKTNTFSSQSDVWAYGITLWEMFSLGDVPYPGIEPTADFVQNLENGLRNFKPQYASEDIYDLMIRCWRNDPDQRPTFSSMKIILGYAVSNGATNIYIPPESTFENTLQLALTTDYLELSD